jgi:hypothetical protein
LLVAARQIVRAVFLDQRIDLFGGIPRINIGEQIDQMQPDEPRRKYPRRYRATCRRYRIDKRESAGSRRLRPLPFGESRQAAVRLRTQHLLRVIGGILRRNDGHRRQGIALDDLHHFVAVQDLALEQAFGDPHQRLVSETCARERFPNQEPIGKQIQFGGRDDSKPWMSIVGIVGDVRQYASTRRPTSQPTHRKSQDL